MFLLLLALSANQLFQQPTLSQTQIAFVYGGDLWIVAREGGEARRLTTGTGIEYAPHFSPDGETIAFSGEYDGNYDVYTIPTAGGVPRRLTHHPASDTVLGWTPDGRRILFRSTRSSSNPRYEELFTVSRDGGFPEELPLPMGEQASYSADGARIAYVPYWNQRTAPYSYVSWKRYHGGSAPPIWIAKLADSSIEKVTKDGANELNPMWIGNKVYFLSDRKGLVSLFSYDTATKLVKQEIADPGSDIKSAAAGPGAIVYERLGSIHLFDLKSGKSKQVEIHLDGDVPGVRPRFERVGSRIQSYGISPTGARAVFEARGDIFTVPFEKGDVRNLTQTSGTAERDPAWSPDGKWIAYFSDESGEYAMHLRQQDGRGDVKKIALGLAPSYFYMAGFSPDSKKIAYTDKRLNVWYVDIDKGTPVKVDTDTYDTPDVTGLRPVWSPDSKWIAYAKQLTSHLRAIFLFSVEDGKAHQLTDGMSDAAYPAFDKNGKYLYFTASTDIGPTTGWLDLSSLNRPVSRSVYAAVLAKDLPSPLAPESDEEKEAKPDAKPADKDKKDPPVIVKVDFERISQRIVALPIPARNYTGLAVAKTGVVFVLESAPVFGFGFNGQTLHKFELEKRKVDKVMENITAFEVSANGEKMLYRQAGRWTIAPTMTAPKPGEGALRTQDMEARIDPPTEWRQMFHETWRIQRDFLYDPGAHGLDLQAAEKKYAEYLPSVAHRADLNYLFDDMLGEITLGHTFVGGGDQPNVNRVPVGLLGADYKIENGRYRLVHIYDGESWNPTLRAPLTQPGVNVAVGDYLLSVNGKDVPGTEEVYKFFQETAGKQTLLKIGPNPDGKDSREVTVVPVANEGGLRLLGWVEGNRRMVDQLSKGKLAYVYLPDTSVNGYAFFNRYYFAQVGKQGVVVDERFNGGGSAADYIIDYLRRPLASFWTTREGQDFTTPLGTIFGPRTMVINEFAGSGGDALPWYFRNAKLGPLVGKRTWGGLVGIYGYPELIDGGGITAPRLAFWNPNGTWDVENHGVAPDIEVELDPKVVRDGHDPQLEKAVQVTLDALEKAPVVKHTKPAYPNYHKPVAPK